MIYLITTSRIKGTKYCKIGYSKNPSKRIKEIQGMCPLKLTLIAEFEGDYLSESVLHNYFSEERVQHTKEWFYVRNELKELVEYWTSNGRKPTNFNEFLFSKSPKRAKDKLRSLYPDIYSAIFG